ncbi:MAG: alpha/beta hydrolase [Hyphomicrobiales bacterium]
MTEEALYRGMSRAELEREYSPSTCIGGDIAPFVGRYMSESAEARRTCRVLEDISYGPRDTQVLDLFLPDDAGAAPVHLFIHGGYWQELSHKDAAAMAPALGSHGIAFAAVNYTLAPEATIAEMTEECRRAVAWIARHGVDHGLDGSRITASGHSAGAQLLAMLLAADWPETAGICPVSEALLISGIYDLEPIRHTYINDPLGLDAGAARAMSPLHAGPVPACPIRIVVGEIETPEFHRQSRAYAELLRAQGAEVSDRVLDGLNHFDIVLSERTFEEVARMAAGGPG